MTEKLIEKKDGYDLYERSIYDGDAFIKIARTKGGHYIGSLDRALQLVEKMGIAPELAHPGDRVCSIGWCEKEQKWYGWSHRAICGFGIGDEVSEGDCVASSGMMLEAQEAFPQGCRRLPVGFKAQTLWQAKLMAIAFASSVS